MVPCVHTDRCLFTQNYVNLTVLIFKSVFPNGAHLIILLVFFVRAYYLSKICIEYFL